jgi:uncharacterized membrane protein YgcG
MPSFSPFGKAGGLHIRRCQGLAVDDYGGIIGNVIAPEFKNGRFDLGVIAGVSAIIGAVRGEFQAWNKPVHAPAESLLIFKGVIGIVLCIVFLVLLMKDNFFSPAAMGGIIVPTTSAMVFDPSIIDLLGLSAVGFVAGLMLALVKRLFRSKDRYRAYRTPMLHKKDEENLTNC